MLYGPDWEKLKRCFDFTNGKRFVLTNMLRNDLRVLVVGDDGYEINHENIPRIKGHFVVHEDEEAVFYETLCRHVKNESSLAIPSDIVSANDLFIFEHAKILYGKKSYRLELHQEFYNDDPSCVNEIEVYVEKNMMEVVLGTCKGVVIEEVVEDDEVKKASKTGNTDFSHETLDMKNKVKAKQEMEELVHNDFHPLMYEDDLFQKEDPVNYKQDPYHGEDEDEENVELFDEQDHLLEHVPFLKETVIIVDGDSLLLVVDALVVPPVIDLEEQLERPNKRRKLNPA
nr:hypothetical protein [Tanacetum cinerariifolium]